MGKMLTVKDVQERLSIGQRRAYELIKLKGFPMIKFGRTYRIPEDKFEKWLDDNESTTIYFKK